MPASITIVNNIPAVTARITEFVDVAVKGTGDEMVGVLKGKMLEPKSGRQYGSHIASAPGEPPANWTGVLMGTIENVPQGVAETEVRAGNESAPYLAAYLEWGSPGGKIAPRPLVTPTAEEFKSVLTENVIAAVEDAVNI